MEEREARQRNEGLWSLIGPRGPTESGPSASRSSPTFPRGTRRQTPRTHLTKEGSVFSEGGVRKRAGRLKRVSFRGERFFPPLGCNLVSFATGSPPPEPSRSSVPTQGPLSQSKPTPGLGAQRHCRRRPQRGAHGSEDNFRHSRRPEALSISCRLYRAPPSDPDRLLWRSRGRPQGDASGPKSRPLGLRTPDVSERGGTRPSRPPSPR